MVDIYEPVFCWELIGGVGAGFCELLVFFVDGW